MRRRQLPQPRQVLRLSTLLKLTAAGRVAADGAEEVVCAMGEMRRCRYSGRNRDEDTRDCCNAVTSRLGQLQRLLAVAQTSSCDHKLHRTKKLPTGAIDHTLNCSLR